MKLNLLRVVSSWKRWTAVCAVVLAMAVTLASQTTQRPNRITHELNSGPVVTISGTVHPLTRQARDLGEANPGMRLESMTLNTAPSVADQLQVKEAALKTAADHARARVAWAVLIGPIILPRQHP